MVEPMAALLVERATHPDGPYGRAPPVLGSKANLSDCIRNNKSLAHSTIKLALLKQAIVLDRCKVPACKTIL